MATAIDARAAEAREQLLDRFVMLDAVAAVISHLTDGAIVDSRNFEPTPWGDRVDWETVTERLSSPEFDLLWPAEFVDADELPTRPDFQEAYRRSAIFAAELLALLAANPQHCARRAAWLLSTVGRATEKEGAA